jgi:hypothetical protein
VVEALSVPGSSPIGLRWQVAYLERFVRRRRDLSNVRAQLAALRPDVLISTACIAGEEHPYLLAARDLGIRTLGCILSFDNLTSRTVLPAFDDYAVWNGRMRDQVLSLYPDRDPARVHITGTPQFDFHVHPRFRESRACTMRRLGLEPEDRFVLYAANSEFFTPSEPELVADLARRFRAMPELEHHRIVVRLHPLDDYGRWDHLPAIDPHLIISRPWDTAAGAFDAHDQTRLISTVLHADACLNTGSTISLDAAALDTPVVCVAFAGHPGGEEGRLCRDLYQTEHYRHIVESQGVRLGRDMNELVAETAAYVRDRSRDRRERSVLVKTEIGIVDGRAVDRVAALVKRIASAAHG